MEAGGATTRTLVGALLILLLALIGGVSIFLPHTPPESTIYKYDLDALKGLSFSEKVAFVKENGFDSIRNGVYLDWATKALTPNWILDNFTMLLRENLYGNTHSESQSSERSMDVVDDLRRYITSYLGVSLASHVVIFTHSQAQAIKTLVEAFPFTEKSQFMYSRSSSADILGLRGIPLQKGASVSVFDDLPSIDSVNKTAKSVVAVPLVDSFDGSSLTSEQLDALSHIDSDAVNKSIITIADATEYIATRKLDLKKYPFDAVVFDTEKIFGFPKAGVLVLHNSVIPLLNKPYFGGGTLVYALTTKDKEKLRLRPSERFEDGSLPFLNLVAVDAGFKFMEALGWNDITEATSRKLSLIIEKLRALKHSDGSDAVKIYGKNHHSSVAFNFLFANKTVAPYTLALKSALDANIRISGGCQATPGSCFSALGISEAELAKNISNVNMSDFGALKVSVGWATTDEHIEQFDEWVRVNVL